MPEETSSQPIAEPPQRPRWVWAAIVVGALVATVGGAANGATTTLALGLLWLGLAFALPIQRRLYRVLMGFLVALVALALVQSVTDPDGVKRRAEAGRADRATRAANEAAPQTAKNERRLNEDMLGDRWPFSVPTGTLRCLNSAVTFVANGKEYALNGRARGQARLANYAEVEDIWRMKPYEEPSTIVERISIERRREIFAERVTCEDDFDDSDAVDQCKARVQRRAGLDDDEWQALGIEGITRSWPPLSPTRIDISPLIKEGLSLCEDPG